MPYVADWTSNNLEGIPNKGPITIPDKAIVSTATSLILTGKNLTSFGEYQQENFIRLLENFASENAPVYPTVGQLWYDASAQLMKVYKADDNWYGVDSAGGTITSLTVASSTLVVSNPTITSSGTITVNLGASGVVAGSYAAADITVDAYGRVTAAASATSITLSGAIIASNIPSGVSLASGSSVNGTFSGTFSGNSSGTNTGDQTITLTGDVTGSGTGSFPTTLANSGVSAGSYSSANITVDAKGRVTAASTSTSISLSGPIAASNFSGTHNGNTSGTNTGDQTITLTGDVSGSGTGTFAATLAASGVVPGTYNFASLTVDAKGRITAASTGTPVSYVDISSSTINVSGGPITSTGTFNINLPSFGVGGVYSTPVNVAVDNYGRITSIANGSSSIGVLCAQHQTTGNGGAGSTSWATRPLNVLQYNSIPGASLGGSSITLPAGVYMVTAYTVFFENDDHKSRIQNVTNNTTLLLGNAGWNRGGDGANNVPYQINGIITIASTAQIQLQSIDSSTGDAWGQTSTSFGGFTNVWASITLQKVA